MSGGSGIKIGLAVGLFAVAIGVFVATRGDAERPREPEDVKLVDLICVETGEHIQRPPAELEKFEAAMPRHGSRRGASAAEQAVRTVYPIAECGEGGAVLANRCPKCGGYYPAVDAEGQIGYCPSCP